ncbi:MAG: ATP-dependent helicase [Lachnospiraceae bacterium]|jgi:DNA helicase-2/ATP-dependent DNA helicase PcrA|nr:ATP-dependent helicase [Lachnospiraceae bacterium]
MPPPTINPAQGQAIAHTYGPIEVLAGPGSGKTFTIVKRILYLIERQKIPPEKILVITFTKAAALEMQSRFLNEIRRSYSAVNFGTFHSVYYQMLTRSGYAKDSTLISEQDKRKILRHILHHLFPHQTFGPADYAEILNEISLRKNREPPRHERERFADIYDEYREMMKEAGKIDFDDMILCCHEMLRNDEKIRRTWQNYFSFIMVDEFQDINRLQYQALKLIAAPRDNLFVVGDDDQSIYGFRGANPAVMQDFLRDFPACEQVLLGVNYRSTKQVVAAASQVIACNQNRLPKDYQALREGARPSLLSFAARDGEDAWLLAEIEKLERAALADAAVIVRTNFEVSLLAAKCANAGIPVQTTEKTKDVFSHFIASDLLDYLHFSGGRRERSRFLNIVNKPLRYLSRKCVANLTGEVNEEYVLEYYQGNCDGMSEVRRFFADCRRLAGMPPYLALNFIRKGIGYERYLKDKARPGEFAEWLEVCDQLQESARGLATHEEWFELVEGLKKATEDNERPPEATAPRNGLNIITLHGSKGLEFHTVFLPHLNEGTLPGGQALSDEQIEEERRLFYVGMTRAKERLCLTYTESKKFTPSRFLKALQETSKQ